MIGGVQVRGSIPLYWVQGHGERVAHQPQARHPAAAVRPPLLRHSPAFPGAGLPPEAGTLQPGSMPLADLMLPWSIHELD